MAEEIYQSSIPDVGGGGGGRWLRRKNFKNCVTRVVNVERYSGLTNEGRWQLTGMTMGRQSKLRMEVKAIYVNEPYLLLNL